LSLAVAVVHQQATTRSVVQAVAVLAGIGLVHFP
jgi:hypothetical protein